MYNDLLHKINALESEIKTLTNADNTANVKNKKEQKNALIMDGRKPKYLDSEQIKKSEKNAY